MKPHPRIRKTVKWGGAVITALLVTVWLGSGHWNVIWTGDGWSVGLARGRLIAGRFHLAPLQAPLRGLEIQALPYSIKLWFLTRSDRIMTYSGIPLWLFASATLATSVIAWRMDAAARENIGRSPCAKCGYDRTGLAAGAVCPECGSKAGGGPS